MKREDLVDCQHDLGMFIRNNWLYDETSPLVRALRLLGIEEYNENVLSALIIEVFWEHLQGEEFIQNEFLERLKQHTTTY